MIIIKKIEFLETGRDPFTLLAMTPRDEFVWCGGEPVRYEVFSELIRGRRFHRPSDGKKITVGISKEAQDILGLQYDAWEEMENALNTERRNHHKTKTERDNYKNRVEKMIYSSFWQRLKWLFFGCSV